MYSFPSETSLKPVELESFQSIRSKERFRTNATFAKFDQIRSKFDQIRSNSIKFDQIRSNSIKFDQIRSNSIKFDQIRSNSIKIQSKERFRSNATFEKLTTELATDKKKKCNFNREFVRKKICDHFALQLIRM
jgi:hypothetical protein